MESAREFLGRIATWLRAVIQGEFGWSREWFGVSEAVAAGIVTTAIVLAVIALAWRLRPVRRPTTSEVTQGAYRYWAFISYSRRDEIWGAWLHKQLESYRVPRALIGTAGRDGPVPNGLLPVFRDLEELPASANLGEQITEALGQSASLIVICSPNSAQSTWVNQEILTYKKLGREDRILAMIIDGEPNAADKPGIDASLECFAPALKWRAGPDEELTPTRTEPIAADTRKQGEGAGNAKLKLIAGVLGVSYDGLKRREDTRRLRRLLAATSAIAVGLGALGFYLWQLYDRGTLEAQSEPINSAITIDDRMELGGRIKGLSLRRGTHSLTAWAPGHFELRRSIYVPRQGSARTNFWLDSGFDRDQQGELHRSNAVQSGLILIPTEGDTIVAHNELGRIIFLSTATGRLVAEFPTPAGNLRAFLELDLGGEIGKVIVSGFEARQSGPEVLVIKASPEPVVLWRWQGPAPGLARPEDASIAVAAVPTGSAVSPIAVAGRDGQLYILDGRNGQQIGNLQFSSLPLRQAPVLLVSRDGDTATITVFFRQAPGPEAPEAPPRTLPLQAVSLQYPTGEVRWRREDGPNLEGPSPAFRSGGQTHFVIWTSKSWQVINALSGVTQSSGELPAAPIGGPAFADLQGRGEPDLIFAFSATDPPLLALRKSDGAVVWRGPRGLRPLAQLRGGEGALLRSASGALLFDLEDGLAAIDPNDGHLVWKVAGQPIGALVGDWNGDGRNETIVALADVGLLCIDDDGRVLWTLRLASSNARPRALIPSSHGGTTHDILMLTHASAISLVHGPRLFWRYSAPAVQQATPVAARVDADKSIVLATVHVGEGRARLRAIEGIEGGVRWEAKEWFYPNRGAGLAQLDGKGPPVVVALGWRPSQEGIHLLAYDPSSGELLRDVPTAIKGWFSCTPAVADFRGIGQSDVAFSVWDERSIVMVDGRSGGVVWRHPTAAPNMQGISVADLDADGVPDVVAASLDGHVYGLRGRDGAVLWKQPIEGGGWSQPVFANLEPGSAGHVLVVSLPGRLHVLDARTGDERWAPSISGGGKVAGHPVVFERQGRTIIAAPLGAAGVVAFDWNRRTELWRSPIGSPVIASPVLADFWGDKGGSIVVAAVSGDVFVLSAYTGQPMWQNRVASGLIEADPAIADLDGDGTPDIVIAAHDSKLHALNGAGALGVRR
jgi:outer membrane protein assembly factor BamB